MTSPASSPETRVVRAGVATDRNHGAVIPPIYLSSTYAFAGFKEKRTYDYTRTANPTRDTLGGSAGRFGRGSGSRRDVDRSGGRTSRGPVAPSR